MNDTKCRITILNGSDNDPYCEKIVYLIESLVLIAHFLIDAEKMLNSSVYFSGNTGVCNSLSYLNANILNILFSLVFSDRNLFNKIVVNVGLKIFKRKIVKFNLDTADTKPSGYR